MHSLKSPIAACSPAISVAMAVFNGEKYLQEAVESILSQTLADFDAVIIDDGSVDSSRRILERYASNDSRIHLRSRPNTGFTVALSEAVGGCNGRYIARMDADDISLPDRFQRQYDFLEQHPEVVAVGGQAYDIDTDGLPIGAIERPLGHVDIDRRNLMGRSGTILHPAVMMRRAALQQVGGYRPSYEPAEDLDLFLRLGEIGQLANLPETVIKYRRHLRSASHSRLLETRGQIENAVKAARARRGAPGNQPLIGGPRAASQADLVSGWCISALAHGNFRTLRKYAARLVTMEPLASRSWKILLAAAAPSVARRLRTGSQRPDSPGDRD